MRRLVRRRGPLGALASAALAGLALSHCPGEDPRPLRARVGLVDYARSLSSQDEDLGDDGALESAAARPTGLPTAIACDSARKIVAQARATLAAVANPIESSKLAEATADWLDPHGLWSVAPDSPVGAVIRAEASGLLAELEREPGAGPCAAAQVVGASLAAWSARLRAMFEDSYDRARASTPTPTAEQGFRLAARAPFEDGAVTKTARALVGELGRAAGTLRSSYGAPLEPFTAALRERAAPSLSADDWARVVVAAALRAYVPQLDAHGAWAPLEEELSLYDLALEQDPPARLWSEMTRTALGARIERGAAAPLKDGDVVLRVHGVALAGVSVEQIEQLALIEHAPFEPPPTVTVLRAGQPAPLDLIVMDGAVGDRPRSEAAAPLGARLVGYEHGSALILTLPDVPDDLAARVSRAIDVARRAGDVRGVVLDVRANGGGSTDGAIATLGLFLPGAAMFPMRRRDGSIEVERAPSVAPEHRWDGPLAVLVDSDSASAAEMIAGAIASYRRGPVIGDRTFGKGCAQEYLDDDAHAGVLRLTTLLYALPDGSPVQKVGITPSVHLLLPSSNEHEALTRRALEPWRGPDVRDAALVRRVPWPTHGGRVGPCEDLTVCRALRVLGGAPAAAR
jgi:carboxyl-terminal processing protease